MYVNSPYEWDSFINDKPEIIYMEFFAPNNYPVFPSHWHSNIEILYIRKGSIEIHIGTEVQLLTEGYICFIDSSLPHSGLSKSDDLEYALIHLKLKTLETLAALDDTFTKFLNHEISIESSFKSERIIEIFNRLSDTYIPSSDKNNIVQTGIICELFGYLFLEHTTFKRNMLYDNKQFGEVAKYLNENYAEKISITALAEKYSFDASYFCRKFKEITGVTPSHYLCIQRLSAAEKLLSGTSFSIEIISQKCGFESSNYFIRKFKEKYNLSPLQYRKNVQKPNRL